MILLNAAVMPHEGHYELIPIFDNVHLSIYDTPSSVIAHP